MRNFLILLVAVITVNQALTAEVSIYDEPLMKQTVALDAPVIDGEKTFEMLKQLQPLIPKDKYTMQSELKELIAIFDPKEEVCEGGKIIDINKIRMGPKSLCDPSEKYGYGKNILAYLSYCKARAIKMCNERLRVAYEKTNDEDRKVIEEITNYFAPGDISLKDYRLLNPGDKKESSVRAILKYLKAHISDFDHKMKKKRSRKESDELFNSIQSRCNNILAGIEGKRSFFVEALGEYEMPQLMEKDQQVMRLNTIIKMCCDINMLRKYDVDMVYFGSGGIPVEFKDKVGNFFTSVANSMIGDGGAGDDSSTGMIIGAAALSTTL